MDQPKTDVGGVQTPDPGRAERRLARGLEDVSHLFLSQVTSDASVGGEARGTPAEQTRSSLAEHAIAILSDSSLSLNHDQLALLLNRNTAALEEGLHAIDVNVPCEIGGPISLLAVDRANRLTIIDLDVGVNENLLTRGICHFDWFVRNVPIVRRMYHGHVIDFSSPPRLFLVAPRFSPVLRCVALRVASPQITCFRYQTAAMPNGTGVLFARV